MTLRRQKNIADTAHALDRALDQRDVLIAKLVKCELRIRTLRKRSIRAQKAYVAKGDASVAAGIAPSPFQRDAVVIADLNDEIPL